MKNKLLISLCVFFLSSCNEPQEVANLKKEVATLNTQLENSKPGLGEIMGVIQQHHAKLYFSGENKNWELAAYQMDEIKEGLDQATELHEHFKDVKGSLKELRHLTDEGVRDLETAISLKDHTKFIAAFSKLTASCNRCHQAAEHPFIVIQVPTSPMFSNQKFTH